MCLTTPPSWPEAYFSLLIFDILDIRPAGSTFPISLLLLHISISSIFLLNVLIYFLHIAINIKFTSVHLNRDHSPFFF